MQMYFRANSVDAQLVKRANGTVGLALACPEAGKIMLAEHPVGCQLHGCRIKRFPVMPDASESQRRRRSLGQYPIEIPAARRGKPGMNVFFDSPCL